MKTALFVKKNRPDPELERLKQELYAAQDDLQQAYHHLDQVLEPELKARLSITEEGNPPYLFYNTTYARIYGVEPPEGYRELFTSESYGNTLCTVYEKQ